jgi:hypothetical protein
MSGELASARGGWSGWRMCRIAGAQKKLMEALWKRGARKEPRQVGKPPGLGRSGDLNTPSKCQSTERIRSCWREYSPRALIPPQHSLHQCIALPLTSELRLMTGD